MESFRTRVNNSELILYDITCMNINVMFCSLIKVETEVKWFGTIW